MVSTFVYTLYDGTNVLYIGVADDVTARVGARRGSDSHPHLEPVNGVKGETPLRLVGGNNELSEAVTELAMRVLCDMTNIRLCLRSAGNIDCEIYLHPRDFKEVADMSYPLEPTLWSQRVFECDHIIPGRPVIIPLGVES